MREVPSSKPGWVEKNSTKYSHAPTSHRVGFKPNLLISNRTRVECVECVDSQVRRVENVLRSRGWFRSTDLWVMGPARFLCATLLRARSENFQFCCHGINWQKCYIIAENISLLINFINNRKFGVIFSPNCRAFVAQWLEHWSCKPGVESSNLSEGYYIASRLFLIYFYDVIVIMITYRPGFVNN